MKYKQVDLSSYKLHLIKTDKFKSILFKIVFRDEIKKDEITIRNMLIDNLVFSCQKYPSRKMLSIKKQDLYGADIYGYNKRIGNHFLTEISLSILNPKYTEDIMLEESIAFLSNIIFKPNATNKSFNEEIFNIIKENTKTDIKGLKENPTSYAVTKLKETMAIDKAFSYRVLGYLEDLEKINPNNLYEYYEKILKTNIIDIYVIGDFDFYDMEKIIKANFNFKTIKKDKGPIQIEYTNSKRKENEVIENSHFNQSIVSIGCSLNKLTLKERHYVLTIYNIILGNSPDSKFFKNIREKNSLAYTISSSFKKADDLMLITAGISSKNYQQTITLIKNEMNEMQKGNFNDNDIEKAKELFISVLNDIYEYPESILDYYFSIEYLGAESLEKQQKTIKSITKEDIIKVASKVRIDTIYFLKEKEGDI